MLDILNYRAAELSLVKPGELFLFSQGGDRILALRATDERDPSSTPAVLLVSGKVPHCLAFQTSVSCLVIGQPVVKVAPNLAECFTRSDAAEGPGSLVIGHESVHMLASAAQGGEMAIDLSSGKFGMPALPRWYATRWQLGLEDRWGEFVQLYAWEGRS